MTDDKRDTDRLRELAVRSNDGNLCGPAIVAADTIDALRAERDALQDHVSDLLADVPCACGHDRPDDVCMKHFPMFRKLQAERDALREALEIAESWMDRWATHAGACEKGHRCTCGRTRVLYDCRAALKDT